MLKGKSNIASEDMIEKSTNDWSIVAMVDTNTKNQNDTETDDEDFVMTSTQISNNDGEEKRDSPTYDDIEKALEGKEIPASENIASTSTPMAEPETVKDIKKKVMPDADNIAKKVVKKADPEGQGSKAKPKKVAKKADPEGQGDKAKPKMVTKKADPEGQGGTGKPKKVQKKADPEGQGDKAKPKKVAKKTDPGGKAIKETAEGEMVQKPTETPKELTDKGSEKEISQEKQENPSAPDDAIEVTKTFKANKPSGEVESKKDGSKVVNKAPKSSFVAAKAEKVTKKADKILTEAVVPLKMHRKVESAKDRLKFIQELRRYDGTWIECCIDSCKKWRYMPDVKDPSQVN